MNAPATLDIAVIREGSADDRPEARPSNYIYVSAYAVREIPSMDPSKQTDYDACVVVTGFLGGQPYRVAHRFPHTVNGPVVSGRRTYREIRPSSEDIADAIKQISEMMARRTR